MRKCPALRSTHSLTMQLRHLALAISIATIAACGGGNGTAPGTMRLSLTDAPACGYDNVFVTVEKVRVHQSSSADDNDAGWSEVVLPTPQRVDLLTLTNGTLLPLGQTELPAGTYTQMRLVLGSTPPPGSPAGTMANSIKPTGGVETELTTPSGQQSGLKMNVNIDIPSGQVADFAIDFDACKSFVKSGNSGQYLLKPVLSVIPILSTAGQRIVGFVDPALTTGGTSVSAQTTSGTPIHATSPDADRPLHVVSAADRQLHIGHDSTGPRDHGDDGRASGHGRHDHDQWRGHADHAASYGTGTACSDRHCRAGHGHCASAAGIGSGPTIESAYAAVDGASGAFTFSLPIEAPVRTAYVAGAPTLTFAPDTLALGLYTIEATSAGAIQSEAIDTKAAVAPLTFTFP